MQAAGRAAQKMWRMIFPFTENKDGVHYALCRDLATSITHGTPRKDWSTDGARFDEDELCMKT